jgi:hypothetical protein
LDSGGERAEAYLRLLGEGGLRRTGDRLRDPDAAAGEDDLFRPGRMPARIAEDALRKVRRAGRIPVVSNQTMLQLLLLHPVIRMMRQMQPKSAATRRDATTARSSG